MAEQEILPPEQLLPKLVEALTGGTPLLRAEFEARYATLIGRMAAIDKATDVAHEDMVRVPTQLQQSAAALKELLEQRIQTEIAIVLGELHKHVAETSEKFAALTLLNDKLRIADSTALTAALSAAEKAVGEQNRSSSLAITKSEQGMLEALKQQQVNFQTEIRAITVNLATMQSRLDRGEGSSNSLYSMAAVMGALLALIISGIAALGAWHSSSSVQPTVQYVPAPTALPAPITVPASPR